MIGTRYLSGRRQPAQLPVEEREQVVPNVGLDRFGFGHLGHQCFPLVSFGGHRTRVDRRLIRHLVQPVGDQVAGRDRRRLADQDKEGRLEGVLGIMVIAQDAATHAPDHRSVPAHQCRQR
jgi:hypothetical protein